MSDHVFYRLAPFIQDFIYQNNWTELRAIQVEACRVIFDTDAHLLLSSGTASGKTEAAFLPVLTQLVEDPPASVGVLYIAPIKALINDQFYRLNDLLKEAHVPVWHWHGDVAQSHKQKMLREPSGVLQITPESLESMLLNKNRDLVRIFGDLRFIIIDEVHAFMGTDRGIQILCQLERLATYTMSKPRRIGLSATLGDYTLAEKWLSSGTDRRVITPQVSAGKQKIRLSVEHFYEPAEKDKGKKEEAKAEASSIEEKVEAVPEKIVPPEEKALSVEAATEEPQTREVEPEVTASAFWEYLYEKSLNKKCIIFANFREWTETTIATLRQIAEMRGTPDNYHVHHGSISASLRETAETDMKESQGPVVIAATVSLEMGIDIGQLERIIQIEAPISVSSFLQRLGRSGRRGNAAEMWFVCPEEKPSGVPLLPDQIPWRFLQTIAIIQLYIEEKWIEPPKHLKYPLSMLYHQTMSVVAGLGEISPPALARRVLGLSAFRDITQEDYRELLHHLVALGHLQLTEEGGIIIGLDGEKIVRNHKFYAVFPEEEDYAVMEDSRQIGRIEIPPPPGERMTLAGKSWEVLEVDLKRKVIFVKRIKGKIRTFWKGDSAKINNKVLKRMRQVLLEDTDYPYLQENAKARLREVRFLARNAGFENKYIFSLGGNTCCILPWIGNVDYHTLVGCIRYFLTDILDIKNIGGYAPYYITVKLGKGNASHLYRAIEDLFQMDIDPNVLINESNVMDMKKNFESKVPKFDRFVTPTLLKKALVQDYIDIPAVKKEVSEWKQGES